jgi:integrase
LRHTGRVAELLLIMRVTLIAQVDSPGPTALQSRARGSLRRLATRVDEGRSPRTTATIDQLLERHLALFELEPSTLATYRPLTETHIRPLIGRLKVGALRADIFDSFYAELRRCRAHCDRRPYIEHRTNLTHECDQRCGRHQCRPLSKATIRLVHVILTGALNGLCGGLDFHEPDRVTSAGVVFEPASA